MIKKLWSHFTVKMVTVCFCMAIGNAAIATLLGIEMSWWQKIVYNLGQIATGGAIMYFIMMNCLRRIVRKEIEAKQGCKHPGCMALQKWESN